MSTARALDVGPGAALASMAARTRAFIAEKRRFSKDGTRRSSASIATSRALPHASNARAFVEAGLDAKPWR
jgi:hypothetical protein